MIDGCLLVNVLVVMVVMVVSVGSIDSIPVFSVLTSAGISVMEFTALVVRSRAWLLTRSSASRSKL